MDELDTEAMDRSKTIEAIMSLKPIFKREYLNNLTTDALHDLEESLILTLYET